MEKTATKTEEELDTRVGEFASYKFRHDFGYKGKLPDLLVETYNNFKRNRDIQVRGHLSPVGFATVIALYELEKKLAPKGKRS